MDLDLGGKPPAAGHNSETVAAAELRQFVERIERLEAEMKDLQDDRKEVYAEAKGRGYDTKVIRAIVARRKKDKEAVAEFEAVMELYMASLGMI